MFEFTLPTTASSAPSDRRAQQAQQATQPGSRAAILARLPEVAARIAEGAAQRELQADSAGPAVRAIFAQLRRTGLTWLRVPQALGGPGGSAADQTEVVAALAAADSGVAHALRSHFAFLEQIALDPAGRAARHAGKVLAGALFGGAHMEVGTPRPNQIRTTLRRDGEHFRLDGRKYYATGALHADYTSFSAVDEQGQPTGALVPADRPGIRILDDWDGMGQRLSASGSVVLDGVRVEPHEVGTLHAADPFMRRHLAARAQLHLMAVVAGIVRNVERDAVQYVRQAARSATHSASATAAGDAFVQQTVGEIGAASHAVDLLVAETARRLDDSAAAIAARTAGQASDAEVDAAVLQAQLANSRGQVVIGRLALRAAEQLFDTGGGSATSRSRNFDRHWRNVRTLLNHNPAALRGRVLGDYALNGQRSDFDEGRVF
jgi:alkylation response protein AidB-like acyl-CoA dehydrogenase